MTSVKHETWLRPNRRALAWGGAAFALLSILALVSVMMWATSGARWVGVSVAVISGCLSGLCLYLMITPRLAYADGHLLVHLQSGPPIRVPIDVVECFFLGQGPALLPQPFGEQKPGETSTIVVRLAESATDWKHREVKPTLGQWCEGYITIRGTWCEPITNELLKQLNGRLIAAHRQIRQAHASQISAPTTEPREVG